MNSGKCSQTRRGGVLRRHDPADLEDQALGAVVVTGTWSPSAELEGVRELLADRDLGWRHHRADARRCPRVGAGSSGQGALDEGGRRLLRVAKLDSSRRLREVVSRPAPSPVRLCGHRVGSSRPATGAPVDNTQVSYSSTTEAVRGGRFPTTCPAERCRSPPTGTPLDRTRVVAVGIAHGHGHEDVGARPGRGHGVRRSLVYRARHQFGAAERKAASRGR